MQMEIPMLDRPRDRVRRRSRASLTEADRLPPAHGIRQCAVIVIGAGIAPDPDHRQRRQLVPPREQVHVDRAAFERHRRGIEGGRGAAQYGNGLATQGGEIDPLRGTIRR